MGYISSVGADGFFLQHPGISVRTQDKGLFLPYTIHDEECFCFRFRCAICNDVHKGKPA